MRINKNKFLGDLLIKLSQSKKPVIYLAGKVTGLPVNEYLAKFKEAQVRLESKGFNVLNPCEFISPDMEWEPAMRIAATLLNMSEHIYLLPDWKDSNGAQIEFSMSVKFGISLYQD